MSALHQVALDAPDQFLVGVVPVTEEDAQRREWFRFRDLAMRRTDPERAHVYEHLVKLRASPRIMLVRFIWRRVHALSSAFTSRIRVLVRPVHAEPVPSLLQYFGSPHPDAKPRDSSVRPGGSLLPDLLPGVTSDQSTNPRVPSITGSTPLLCDAFMGESTYGQRLRQRRLTLLYGIVPVFMYIATISFQPQCQMDKGSRQSQRNHKSMNDGTITRNCKSTSLKIDPLDQSINRQNQRQDEVYHRDRQR